LSHTFYRRLELSKAAFIMLETTWLTGIGGGAFYSQFSPYRTLEIGNTYYNYAHNDILQFWIEYGLIGVSLLVLFLATLIRDNIRILSQSRSGIQATFAYASIYSTLAVAIHSLVDFPLHIPGFSVCYLVIISVNSLSLINRSQFNDAANRT
jgi:O-antigen ligase